MKPRRLVGLSGLLFAALALFSYKVFGWRLDGWILALTALLHLGVVLRDYPRVDRFLVWFHYLVLLIGLTGVAWVLIDVTGSALGVPRILLPLLCEDWTDPVTYAFLGMYFLVVTSAWLFLILTVTWIVHRRKPRRPELLAGLFVASLLTIPCHFALADVLSAVAVLNPEEAGAFVFAVGLLSLDVPIALHVLTGILVAAALRRHPTARSE